MRPFDPRLSKYAKVTYPYLLSTVFIGIANTLLIILFSQKIAFLVTYAFQNKSILQNINQELSQLVFIVLVRSFLVWLNEIISIRSSSVAKAQLREAVIKHAQKLGPVTINKFRASKLANTLTTGIDGLDSYFSKYLPQLVLVIISPIMIGFTIFKQDLLSLIIVLFTLPIIPMFMVLVGWFTNKENEKQWESLQKLSNYMSDIFKGFSTLAINKRLSNQDETLKKVSGQYRKNLMNVLKISFLSSFVLELAATLSVALIAVSIGVRLVDGNITLFSGLFVLLLAPEVYLPMRTLGANYHAAAEGLGATNELFHFLEEKPIENKGKLSLNAPEKIEVKNLTVNITNDLIIENINFESPKNKLTVLIGASGSGKTSLINALLGFLPIENGSITFVDRQNITNISEIDINELRKNISLLSQFPYLSPGTVASNVRLSDSSVTDEEIFQLLKRLQIQYLLNQEIHQNGLGISTGEKRRIALARILIKPKPIIILDEPTASLDKQSEEIIISEIKNLSNKNIVIAATHDENLINMAENKIHVSLRNLRLVNKL